MMSGREGMTLMEIIVVLIIVGIAAACFFPNYTTPIEKARAANAQNNLLAIYSAERNYNNNINGAYCLAAPNTASSACNTLLADNKCADTLAAINCNLSLNIQDDGTYLYDCGATTANACTATRKNGPAAFLITVALNSAIQLNGEVNPSCSTSYWCP